MSRDMNRLSNIRLALRVFTLAISASIVAGMASAQIETQPQWGVLEFSNKGEQSMPLGKMAATAISDEIKRQGKIDVVPEETISRTMADLGYQAPINKPTEIQRLGQNLQAVSIVTGDVMNWRVVSKPEGKQAQVLLKVTVWDVASGLPVNGAALSANSDMRTGEVSNEELLKSALAQGSFESMREISARTLPFATVLNTLNNRALINKGSRAGFGKDMRVVVTRGKAQVAEGIIRDVDPDSSFLETTRSFRGIQPGDKVRSVFDPPDIKSTWAKDGSPQVKKNKSSGSNSGLVSLVIVLLILGFLLLGGRGSNQEGVGGVNAEAVVLPNDVPAVKISWTRDAFFRATNQGAFQFQVWREGSAVPVSVASKTSSYAYNDINNSFGGTWYDFGGTIGGNTCDNSAPPAGDGTAGVAAVAGTPYQYSVEVVYTVHCFDLPDACSSGSTGSTATTGSTGSTATTGTTGTSGLTTGGTTGTTGTTGSTATTGSTGTTGNFCYFVTARTPAAGQATPLSRPSLRSPDDNAVVNSPLTFGFTSVRGNVVSVPLEYVVQFSATPDFPGGGRTITTDPFVELVLPGGQTVSSSTIDTSTILPTSSVLYWRVGVRNPDDVPGPVADASGKRYIFSARRHFRRPTNP